jgi:hypothetical protein
MSALADIFAAIHLTLDGTGFEAQATALASKSGKNVGDTLSKNINDSLTKAARGAVGAAAGYATATAINGATQLNELAGEYQVQTGASAEEAKKFEGTLNDLFKVSHQGYGEISDTLIGLKTHFDLTGQAASDTAAKYLDFAEIAGGTGADAVERFNSLVKTGIITQDQAVGTMDDLIVAHQKFGVPINATIDGMIKLAPAMNAVGMSSKEGAALVGLFTKAGVSGDRMAQAFNTSLTKIKSPAEFPALLKSITDAKTDFEASNIAADYFGTRVGPGLANLLRSGGGALDSYNATLGDTTGALETAARANDNTFGGQALLMLHQFQGGLAGIGTNMGDLLIVFSMLGPGLTKGLLTGLGGLVGLMFSQGTAAGASLVAGETGAVAAGGPAVAGAVAATSGEVTAPTEEEIRAEIARGWNERPPVGPTPHVSFEDGFTYCLSLAEGLYDSEDFRRAEQVRFDQLMYEPVERIRVAARHDLEEAIVSAALAFAAEHPDAPRATRESVR